MTGPRLTDAEFRRRLQDLTHRPVGGQVGPTDTAGDTRRSRSMSDPFDGPGQSAGALDYEALKGSLLLITPRGVENISTTFGPKDAVRGDVAVLDGPESGDMVGDALIFPSVLVGQLRAAAGTGRMVLGRLSQGNAKPGQKPPWRLDEPTEQDKTAGRAWLAKNAPAPY